MHKIIDLIGGYQSHGHFYPYALPHSVQKDAKTFAIKVFHGFSTGWRCKISMFLSALFFSCVVAGGEDSSFFRTNFPAFSAEGTVSAKMFRSTSTNAQMTTEGRFSFSYNKGFWHIQYKIENAYTSLDVIDSSQSSGFSKSLNGVITDYKRIPDGIRYFTSRDELEPNGVLTAATVEPIQYPKPANLELFLAWLSLCPNANLPRIDDTHIQVFNSAKLVNRSENLGLYSAKYIGPENVFLSEITVTNSGTVLGADGSSHRLDTPFENGHIEYQYQVLDLTNFNGFSFPRKAIIYRYSPKRPANSSQDVYPVMIGQIEVKQISSDENGLAISTIRPSLMAFDTRPTNLYEKAPVNYVVTNDEWPSMSNQDLIRKASYYRNLGKKTGDLERINQGDRSVFAKTIVILAFTVPPALWWIFRRNQQK